jgi:DNA topoisomerase-3
MVKLLATGKTDLLEKFVSMRTRRPFKAFLVWDKEAGKVNFEFAPSKFPRRPRAAAAVRQGAPPASSPAKGGKKARSAKKDAAPKTPRKSSGKKLSPSPVLAAVVGGEPLARTEVVKKLWEYIKANGLQDAANKRAINADEKLLPVFGKPQVTMFEIAKLIGNHLS